MFLLCLHLIVIECLKTIEILWGGVVIYVKDKCQATKLLGMCIIEECIETVFIRVSLGKNKYV